MNFDFSDDQKLLQQTAKDFLDEHAPLSVCREMLESDEPYSQEPVEGRRRAGLARRRDPRGVRRRRLRLSRAGGDRRGGRSRAGADPLLVERLPRQRGDPAGGLRRAEEAHSPAARRRRGDRDVRARREARTERRRGVEARVEGGKLSGTKLPVPDGDVARLAVVARPRRERGLSLYLVVLADAGVTREAVDPSTRAAPWRGSSSTARRRSCSARRAGAPSSRTRCSIAPRCCWPSSSWAAPPRALRDHARLHPGALRLRSADRVLPGHQAPARGPVVRDRARALQLLLRRLGAQQRRPRARPRRPASPASRPARPSISPAVEMIQFHGGVGYTWEYDCHLFYRRAKCDRRRARQPRELAGEADHPARGRAGGLSAAQRVIRHPIRVPETRREERPWTSTTPPKKRPSAPKPAPGSRPTRSAGRPTTSRRRISASASTKRRFAPPRPGRRRRRTPAGPASPGPRSTAGAARTAIQSVIWGQEESKFRTPPNIFGIGHGMCGPTIMTHGTPEQKERWIPKLLTGEEIWCQLFSEPSAGSDLAGLRTTAVKDGDDWVINGQKIWTTGAQFCDWGILVVRTDPDVVKHAGLTYFVVDMHAPGIEIEPIVQINGGTGFNEVFFDDVRIPDANRISEVGNGWAVAITTLMNERASIGGRGWHRRRHRRSPQAGPGGGARTALRPSRTQRCARSWRTSSFARRPCSTPATAPSRPSPRARRRVPRRASGSSSAPS